MIAQAAQTYGLIVNDLNRSLGRVPGRGSGAWPARASPTPTRHISRRSATGACEDPNFLLASFPWAELQLVAPSQ